MHNTGIKPQVLSEVCVFSKKHNVDKVILFGSRARGDYTPKSDIDLAVIGGDIVNFSLDINEKTSTLLCFDIINMNDTTQKEFLDSIRKEGIVIYEKA